MASRRKLYMAVFAGLFLLTILEVGIVYTDISRTPLVMGLIALALAKAMCVAMYFMHLKWESRTLRLAVGVPMLVFPPLYAIVLIAEAAWRLAG